MWLAWRLCNDRAAWEVGVVISLEKRPRMLKYLTSGIFADYMKIAIIARSQFTWSTIFLCLQQNIPNMLTHIKTPTINLILQSWILNKVVKIAEHLYFWP